MFRNLGGEYRMTIPPDEEGYTGRECPNLDCKGYFKIVIGTGLKDINHCYCPYCGHKAKPDEFHTEAQIEYAKSVVLHQITGQILKDLKKLETRHRSSRNDLFRLEVKVTGKPIPIHYYQEKQLETHIECDHCTLKYAVYGVFAYCPDCGTHNSQQILNKNLELAQKEIDLSATLEGEMVSYLIQDALENAVSAFDGFGREICRVYAYLSTNPTSAAEIKFQNLAGAQKNVQNHFGFDISSGLSPNEWDATLRCFQKRHLLAHSMGVIDDDYIAKANDPKAIKGHKVTIESGEVTQLLDDIRKLGAYIVTEMRKLSGTSTP